MVSGDFLAHVDQVFLGHAEFRDLALGRDRCLGEMTAHRSGRALCFRNAGAQLDGSITVAGGGALIDDLKAVELQNGHRNLTAVFQEQPGHAQFLGDNTSTQHHPLLTP